jgi:hypothetical protein
VTQFSHSFLGKMITPDQEESLNVASQCLAMAFNTTPDDAEDLPCLLDLLTEAAPDRKYFSTTVDIYYD